MAMATAKNLQAKRIGLYRTAYYTRIIEKRKRKGSTENLLLGIVVFDFCNRRKRDFYYFTGSTFNLDTWRSQGLSGLHTLDHAPDALTIDSYNFDVVFSV